MELDGDFKEEIDQLDLSDDDESEEFDGNFDVESDDSDAVQTRSNIRRARQRVNADDPHLEVCLPNLFEMYFDLYTIYYYAMEGIIDLSPNFQREVVWSTEAQKLLIHSIASNVCLPPLIFNCILQEGRTVDAPGVLEPGAYICCDGKQRITSIVKFMNNEIYFMDDNRVKWYYNLKKKDTATMKSLTKERRAAFDERKIGVACYYNLDRDQESLLFGRIQEGKALTLDEKLRAVVGGKLTEFVETVLEKYFTDEDRGISANSRITGAGRGKDFTIALRCILNIIDTPQHRSQAVLGRTIESASKQTTAQGEKVTKLMDRFLELTLIGNKGSVRPKDQHKVWHAVKVVAPVEVPWFPVLVDKFFKLSNGQLLEVIELLRHKLKATFPNNMSINSSVENWIATWIKEFRTTTLKGKYNDNGTLTSSSKYNSAIDERVVRPPTAKFPSSKTTAASPRSSKRLLDPPSSGSTKTSTQKKQKTSSSTTASRPATKTTPRATSSKVLVEESSDSEGDSNVPLRLVKNNPSSPNINGNGLRITGLDNSPKAIKSEINPSPRINDSRLLQPQASTSGSTSRLPTKTVPSPPLLSRHSQSSSLSSNNSPVLTKSSLPTTTTSTSNSNSYNYSNRPQGTPIPQFSSRSQTSAVTSNSNNPSNLSGSNSNQNSPSIQQVPLPPGREHFMREAAMKAQQQEEIQRKHALRQQEQLQQGQRLREQTQQQQLQQQQLQQQQNSQYRTAIPPSSQPQYRSQQEQFQQQSQQQSQQNSQQNFYPPRQANPYAPPQSQQQQQQSNNNNQLSNSNFLPSTYGTFQGGLGSNYSNGNTSNGGNGGNSNYYPVNYNNSSSSNTQVARPGMNNSVNSIYNYSAPLPNSNNDAGLPSRLPSSVNYPTTYHQSSLAQNSQLSSSAVVNAPILAQGASPAITPAEINKE